MHNLDPAQEFSVRLAKLERETNRWRIVASVSMLLLGATAFTAFRESKAQPLDGDSLTLRGPHGMAVTLSVTQTGNLEARFDRGTATPQAVQEASLVLVAPNGRTIARLGEPIARQMRP